MKKAHGFTLLELVITLVLVGILSTVAGAGFVSATKGYLFTKDINVNTQNGQATMARLGKMFRNLTDITHTGDNAFKVTYKRNDIDITEEISLVKSSDTKTGILQTIHSGSTNPRIPKGTFTLQDHVSDFTVQYHVAGTPGWVSSPPTGDLRDLALIRVMLKMDIDGTPLKFASNFIPRNVFNAPQNFDPNGLFTDFGSSPNCFVATATYGTPNNPVVLLLRQFRDKYLLTWTGGRTLVNCYYTYGPIAADTIRGNEALTTLSKLVLLPIAGFAYLTLLHPLGLLCIPFVFFLGRKIARTYLPELRNNASGGIMIGIIGAMIFMSLLSGAMLHMYGSTAFATVGYALSPKAYYLAESGLRHVGKVYTEEITKENGEPSNAVRALHNKTFSLPSKTTSDTSSERIHYDIATYWFEAPSSDGRVTNLTFKKNILGSLPPTVTAKDKKGYVYLTSSKKTVAYTGISEDDSGVIFNLNDETTVQNREDILFAGVVDGGASTLSVGGNISIGEAISLFPPAGGIVRIDNGTKEKYAMYARANYAEGDLEGLSEIPGQAKFETSFLVQPNTTTVVLQYHARITSTGSIGSINEPITRTITQSQPLLMINSLVRRTFTDTFDDEQSLAHWKTILGKDSTIENQATDGEPSNNALASTGSTVTYNAIHEDEQSRISVENLTGLDHENQTVKEMLKLHDAWAGNENLLLYDMQVKIKFNENDDVIHSSLNGVSIPEKNYTWGTWMHGLAFHIEENDMNTLTTMYGLSLLSTFRGREYSDRLKSYTDWDGIYDDLQEDHDSNQLLYKDDHYWNDYPIYNGVPYLVFWERTFAQKDFFSGYSLFDSARYLAKYPLADLSDAAFAVYKRITRDTNDGPEYIIHVYSSVDQAMDAYEYAYTYRWWLIGFQHENYELTDPLIKWIVKRNVELSYRNSIGVLKTANSEHYRPAYVVPYVGYTLSPKYNILNRNTIGNSCILGTPTHENCTTTSTGDIEDNLGYVIEAPAVLQNFSLKLTQWLLNLFDSNFDLNHLDHRANILSSKHSYRFWIQDWTTLHTTVTEFDATQTDFPAVLGSNKIVVVSAGFATPNGNGNATGDIKVVGRTAYHRSQQGEPNFQWADRGDYFKLALWESQKGNQSNDIWGQSYRFKNYSSQKITSHSPLGQALLLDSDKKSVFPGLDNENDYIYALAGSFSSPNGTENSETHLLGNIEVGLHSMGIGDFGDGKSEKVYFDDFAIRVYQRNPQGLMPGIQQEN